MVASEPGVQYAQLYCKDLEIYKEKVLKMFYGNYDRIICLPTHVKTIFKWWIKHLPSSYKPIMQNDPDIILFSDSSKTGWGGINKTTGKKKQKGFGQQKREMHINVLELKAAFLTLQSLAGNISQKHIRMNLDNTVAISYIENFGGKITNLHILAKEIWFWCLEPNEELTLLQLSQKLALLLMLLSAQRCQTVHLIKLNNITISNDNMKVYIVDLVKQSKPGKHIGPLEFNRHDDYKLCVIVAMEEYLKRTSKLRGQEKSLFISCVKPFKTVTKSTISRWIKQLLGKAGIDIKVYGTHSCRSASSSSAAAHGIPLNNILKTAGWSSAQTFYKFYFKPIQTQTLSDSLLENK
ncbi:unnamed protein product [Mytilus coruscus]|uniref:Tyr recombinase domain-containing protein n=1 Tax=Mytilus coruscus TaxID=42192 RepID=A0A6J8C900_MYTCO|nr:unnamed protein product [Mytilus coruscus]